MKKLVNVKTMLVAAAVALSTGSVQAVAQWTNGAGDWDLANDGNWSETLTSSSVLVFWTNLGDFTLSRDLSVGRAEVALWTDTVTPCSFNLGGHKLTLTELNGSNLPTCGLGLGAKKNEMTIRGGVIDFGVDKNNNLYTGKQKKGNGILNKITVEGVGTMLTNVHAITMQSEGAKLVVQDGAVLQTKYGFGSAFWSAPDLDGLTVDVLSGAKLRLEHELRYPAGLSTVTVSGTGSELLSFPMYVTHPSKIGECDSNQRLVVTDGARLTMSDSRYADLAVGYGYWHESTNCSLHTSQAYLKLGGLGVGFAGTDASDAYTNSHNTVLLENQTVLEYLMPKAFCVGAYHANGKVGGNTNSFDNALVVVDSAITNLSTKTDGEVTVGYNGSRNRFLMTNSTYKTMGEVMLQVGVGASATSNVVVFNNSTFEGCGALHVGVSGSHNVFRLENGSSMTVSTGYVGYDGSDNLMVVDGSMFTSTGDRFDPSGYGWAASNNTFVACNGATVNLRRLRLGYGGSHHNNLVVSNATVSIQNDSGAFFCGYNNVLNSSNNVVRVQGATPRIVADDHMTFGCNYTIAFDMDETGFAAAPIVSLRDNINLVGPGRLVFEGTGLDRLRKHGGAHGMVLLEAAEGRQIKFRDVDETELLAAWNAEVQTRYPKCRVWLSSDRRRLLFRAPPNDGLMMIVR